MGPCDAGRCLHDMRQSSTCCLMFFVVALFVLKAIAANAQAAVQDGALQRAARHSSGHWREEGLCGLLMRESEL